MRQKQLVIKKLFELTNLLNSKRALISTGRTREEVFQQFERVEQKIKEIEVLVNRENEEWN